MWNDGIVLPTPPVLRALEETVKKLKNAGHEIVDWAPEGHMKALQILVS
jgi:amidase